MKNKIKNSYLKHYLIKFLSIGFVVLLVFFFSYSNTSTILINGKSFEIELAITLEEKIKGLSGRKSLSKNSGMLFIFDKQGIYSFWMKDTFIKLDIAWISNGTIVHIERDINPNTYPSTFSSKDNSRYVLEVNAGALKDTEIGDMVNIFIKK